MLQIKLHSNWTMRRVGNKTSLPAVVPGSVLADLLQAGEIPDPFYAENEKEIKKIFEHSYEYECEFNVNQDFFNCPKKIICFEGLDTLAAIYLNSTLLARTNNMHRTYHFDVNQQLKRGKNHLRIVFESPLKFIQEKQQRFPLWGVSQALPGYPHLRKAHYMFGWDWGPQLIDAGIWREVTLCAYEAAGINDITISQQHQSNQVRLDLHLRIEKAVPQVQIQAEASIYDPQNNCLATQRVDINEEQHFTFIVKNPCLWWPNGYGAQPLYQVKIKLYHKNNLVDEDSKTIGLRTITINRAPDQWGENFAFNVNGVNIFGMGANYIPQDSILARCSQSKTKKLILDCVQANFNCLRVWGGGIYPEDYFFDLCDQSGLIIWHDFMFACAQYNLTTEFTSNIEQEVEDNVRRIRHHACLGLWCGNNEMEWGWVEWALPRSEKLKADYLTQFERVIPDVLARVDPQTYYWPASPSSGGGFAEPNAEHSGDVHYWQVFHGKLPYEEYTKHYFRFGSEFGMQSFPHQATIDSFARPDQQNIFSPVMEFHNKCMQQTNGNQTILFYISEDFLLPKNLEMMIYASQIMQARAIGCAVEHWRRNRGRCMGATYWQLNDSYAGTSWSSIDYYGRWKALHYFAKRFFNPILLSAEYKNNQLNLYLTNETLKEQTLDVSYRLVHQDKGVLLADKTSINARPLHSGCLKSINMTQYLITDEQKRNTWFEYSYARDKEEEHVQTLIFVRHKHFNFLKPALTVKWAHNRLILTSHVYAPYVELYIDGAYLKLENNFFDLVPGKSVSVKVIDNPLKPIELIDKLKMRTICDIAGE